MELIIIEHVLIGPAIDCETLTADMIKVFGGGTSD